MSEKCQTVAEDSLVLFCNVMAYKNNFINLLIVLNNRVRFKR